MLGELYSTCLGESDVPWEGRPSTPSAAGVQTWRMSRGNGSSGALARGTTLPNTTPLPVSRAQLKSQLSRLVPPIALAKSLSNLPFLSHGFIMLSSRHFSQSVIVLLVFIPPFPII